LVVVCYHHVDGRCFRSGLEIYQDKNAPINERVADLMKKMTLTEICRFNEKISQTSISTREP